MTFETFDSKGLHLPPEQRHSLELAFRNARSFAQEPQGWLVFLGPSGCGKTHLAASIGNYQKQQGRPVRFEVVPDLLDHFRSTFSPDSRVAYDELFEGVRTTPLLILDDLETGTSTPWAVEKLYQILNHRYNARLPTVITSRASLDDIEDRLSSRMGDPRLSTVIALPPVDLRIDRKPAEKKPPRSWRRGG
ncbi:MAG: ATP-binding protein, partial [Chloroflexota bacterium]|nr:ATP-binding protein [Chloroflexota bacterium]